MKRAAMLFCANIDPARYKVLRQRGQLPFVGSDDQAANKWADFTLDDAFRLRLSLDLIGEKLDDETQLNGLGPSYVASIVFNVLSKFDQQPLKQDAESDPWAGAKGDLWAGVLALETSPIDDDAYRWSNWFAGELAEVAQWVAQKENEDCQNKTRAVRVFLVNVTRAANFVRDRAKELGLPDSDHSTAV